MPAAAFAVHQLRYWLAFGSQAGAELERQGHSYLHSVAPWIVFLIAVAVGAFLRGLGRAFGGQRTTPHRTVSFAVLWLLCSASLVVIYMGQEFLEGLLATGHPGGLTGIFGFGGWWSVPAAAAVGLALAAVFYGARWVLHEVAGALPPRPRCCRCAVARVMASGRCVRLPAGSTCGRVVGTRASLRERALLI